MEQPEKVCDTIKGAISQIVSRIEKDPASYPKVMDELKTSLYNHHHLCTGPGDRIAQLLPPTPAEVIRESNKIGEAIEEKVTG